MQKVQVRIMNKVILMGRLTRDPEMRNSNGESNTAIARYHAIRWQLTDATSVKAKRVLILSAVWRLAAVQSLPKSISIRD